MKLPFGGWIWIFVGLVQLGMKVFLPTCFLENETALELCLKVKIDLRN